MNENKELLILKSKIEDLCRRAIDNGCTYYTNFLNSSELSYAMSVANSYKGVKQIALSPFDESERNILALYDGELSKNKPFECVKITLKAKEKLTHRDYLGSILALNVKREKFGDIKVFEGGAYVALFKEMSPFLQNNLKKIANFSVLEISVEEMNSHEVTPEFIEITDTIPSPRLDVIVGSLIRCARGKAQELIKAKRVSVNHNVIENNDYNCKNGAIISIKGMGRFVIDDVTRVKKKGRVVLSARKYK